MSPRSTDTPAADLSDDERVMQAIQQFIAEHGYPPEYREIAEIVGLKSWSGIRNVLQRLQKAGKIRYTPGVARSIVVTEKKR